MVKKPKSKRVSCEACAFSSGVPFQDAEDKDAMRLYCKARYANVDIEIMKGGCDHFKVKPEEQVYD